MGEEYGLSRKQVRGLFAAKARERPQQQRDLAGELVRDLTRHSAIVAERDLRARAYQLSAGVCHPARADEVISDLSRTGGASFHWREERGPPRSFVRVS